VIMQAETTGILSLVRCSIGQETFAVDMNLVRHILRSDQITSAPGADGLVGYLAERGGHVPVYCLAERLGRSSQSQGAAIRPVVVLKEGPRPWALLVDRVSQVVRLEAELVAPMPGVAIDPFTNYFEGIVNRDGETLLLLSLTRLNPECAPDDFALSSPSFSHRPDRGSPRAQLAIDGGVGQKKIVLFDTAEPAPRVRRVTFALGITQVLEVLGRLPLLPVPNAPPACLGVVNWREWTVPVLDLAQRLGLAPTIPSELSRLLIARPLGKSDLVGFLVRPAVRVLRLPVAHQPSTRDLGLDWSLVKGCVELKNETLVLPDLAAILG
jgi:purine-binding chemotaxis protein CheW